MKKTSFIKNTTIFTIIFVLFIISLDVYVLLKTFLLSTSIAYVETTDYSSSQEDNENAVISDTSYQDSNISIAIDTIRENNTTIYVADIKLVSADYLKTAFAQDIFGLNITEKTSIIAKNHNAILAINGDYYGANSNGYVIKNGTLYRSSIRNNNDYNDLAIYADGSFASVSEEESSAETLLNNGVVNLFAFGPTLIEEGNIIISESEEVGKAMNENPRTAIGIIDELHYIILVSDGRTSESTGLSLYETAQIMQQYGCDLAYNLDGGGSSTLYFNGSIINNPTTNGKSISEREVSDIVYIGY